MASYFADMNRHSYVLINTLSGPVPAGATRSTRQRWCTFGMEQPSSLAVVKGLPAFPRIGDASSIPSHLSGQVFSENHSNPGIIINSVAINSALNIDPTSVAHVASFEES